VSTSTSSTLLASWDFENNLNENTNTYNGQMTSGTTYISGYINQAFVGNSISYMYSTQYLNFANRAFTIELWMMINANLSSSVIYGIVGQCQTPSNNLCLHCAIRYNKLYFGFYGDDTAGVTTLPMNVWAHVAFVYDFTNNIKIIYLNGILDTSGASGSAYQGTSGNLNIGYVYVGAATTNFPGYIDKVKINFSFFEY
jgi:hypothetical protein